MTRLNCLRPVGRVATLLTLTLFALATGFFPISARAENEGQADLDKATQQKLGAQTAGDLTDVIRLCEGALKKGLDKGNTAFANDLMASALVQRGSLTVAKVYRAIQGLAAGGTARRPPMKAGNCTAARPWPIWKKASSSARNSPRPNSRSPS